MRVKQNYNFKKIFFKYICIGVIFAYVLSLTVFGATIEALYTHDCPKLMKYGNITIKTAYAVVNMDGKEYPVYCLDVSKPRS